MFKTARSGRLSSETEPSLMIDTLAVLLFVWTLDDWDRDVNSRFG